MGWSPHEWHQCPSKRSHERAHFLSLFAAAAGRRVKGAVCEPGRGLSTDTESAGPDLGTSQSPEPCLSFESPGPWCSVTATKRGQVLGRAWGMHGAR